MAFHTKKAMLDLKRNPLKFPLTVNGLKIALYLNIIKSTRIPEKRDVRCVQCKLNTADGLLVSLNTCY